MADTDPLPQDDPGVTVDPRTMDLAQALFDENITFTVLADAQAAVRAIHKMLNEMIAQQIRLGQRPEV